MNERLKKLFKAFKLTEEEGRILCILLEKMYVSKKDQKYIDSEWEETFPFEGGIGFGEALILAKEALQDYKK